MANDMLKTTAVKNAYPTPEQLAKQAYTHSLSVADYLKKYNPITDELLQFTQAVDTGMNVVITAKKKQPKTIHLIAIAVLFFSLALLLITFTKNKR